MFIANKPYKYLSEAATADLMDPGTSDEVKEVIDDLQDDLTNNVEEVPADDMVDNGGVPVVTAESVILAQSSGSQYYVSMEAVMRICEDEAEAAVEGEPTADDVADQADNVIDQIANANGIEPEDVTVVISADEMTYMCECAINESKSNKKKGKKKGGKAAKKIAILSKLTKALKGKVKVSKGKKKK